MSRMLGAFKTRKNGNSLIITVPKDSGIMENEIFEAVKMDDGGLMYKPIKSNPWHSTDNYDFEKDKSLLEIDPIDSKPVGKENI